MPDAPHPWEHAAQSMNPSPLPTMIRFDAIEASDGNDYVMITTATPAGTNNVFIPMENFAELIGEGQKIVQTWSEEQHPLILATPQDLKRDVSLGRLPLPPVERRGR